MNKIYKLENQIKRYEWGSLNLIPEFLGIGNEKDLPYAEMWMGTHSSSLSRYLTHDTPVDLAQISGELPFLFKLIAVDKPLSIQVHPDKERAAEGFSKEERLGIALNAFKRSYKDSNHKPEILCAISPFTLMAGLREISVIQVFLEELSVVLPPLKQIISPLIRALNTDALAVFFRILFNISKLEREYITSFISKKEIDGAGIITTEQWQLMKKLAALYPDDPAILSPLYLNMLSLLPGQAIFIPSGILHSYTSGFGVELMAASDNVIRGGLTPKYVDLPQLMNVADFSPYMPKIHTPAISSWHCFDLPCREFSLAIMQGDEVTASNEIIFPGKGPAICLVTEGRLSAGNLKFKKGDSFFIPKDTENLSFKGTYSLFAALPGKQ
ncbi:MAG: mannose-6-phosphate isomerase, class I [Treponema sp.]|jgi:mannose-6-phosphate isomerase|nr:mannose-6-phosphate isomerase, class I [Treponema sp.]